MMYHFHQNRQSEREHRLCADFLKQPTSLEKAGSYVVDTLGYAGQGVVNWFVETGAWAATEGAENLIRVVKDIPVSIMNGVHAGLADLTPSKENQAWAYNLLLDIKARLQDAPLIGAFLGQREIKNLKTLENLVDDAKWIQLFRDENALGLLDLTAVEDLPQDERAEFGPKELLKALPPETRQQIYLEFLDRYIPRDIQEQMGLSTAGNTVAERYALAKNNDKLLNASMGAMVGMPDWQNKLSVDEQAIVQTTAQKSTENYYNVAQGAMPDNFKPNGRLIQDVVDANAMRPHVNIPSVATDPRLLRQNLPPSRLAGALQLGVVQHEHLQRILEGNADMKHEDRLGQNTLAAKGEVYTGSEKERSRLEAMTLMDSFKGLSGIEKIVLLAASAYALAKYNWVRVGAMGAVGAYMFQRLILKEKDPVRRWSDMANYVKDGVVSANSDLFGTGVTPGSVENWAHRSARMWNFLSPFGRKYLETQSIGFTLLNDMPLNALASSFTMGGVNGEAMDLNARRGSPLDTMLGTSSKAHGYNKRYREFFDQENNCAQTSEAMANIFFMRAANKDPLHMQRAKRIMELRGQFMPGTPLNIATQVINDGNQMATAEDMQTMVDADREYLHMVAEGQQEILANRESMTLGEFVMQNPNMLSLMPQKQAVATNTKINPTFTVAPKIPSTFTAAPGTPGTLTAAPTGTPGTLSTTPTVPSTISVASVIPSSIGPASSVPSSTSAAPSTAASTVTAVPSTGSTVTATPSTIPSSVTATPPSGAILGPAPLTPAGAASASPLIPGTLPNSVTIPNTTGISPNIPSSASASVPGSPAVVPSTASSTGNTLNNPPITPGVDPTTTTIPGLTPAPKIPPTVK